MTAVPYASSREHLHDELAVAEELVKAQTRYWRATIAMGKGEGSWSMAYVDDAEVEAYLAGPFRLGPDTAARGGERAGIRARIEATRPAGVPLRLADLVARFGLGAVDRDLLLLALLPELDSRYRRLYGYLLDDGSQWAPTVGLLDEMLAPHGDFAARSALEPGRPLVEHELVIVAGWTEAEGPARRRVRVDDRIGAYLLDSDAVDPRLGGAARVLDDAEPVDLPDEQARLVGRLAARRGARLVLGGGDARRYRNTAAAVGFAVHRPVLVADAAAVGRDESVVRLAAREARLRGAVLFWQGCAALFDGGRPLPVWDVLVAASAGAPGLTLLDHAAPWDPEGRAESTPMIRWLLPRAGVPERTAQWASLLAGMWHDDDVAALARRLAQTFELSTAQVADAAATAADLAAAAPAVTVDHLLEACRRQTGRRLLTFTRRVVIPPGLDLDAEIVLPAEQKQQLHDLVDRIRLRNVLAERHPEDAWRRPSGVVCMLVGSSGTGKGLAAACVASALGKDLLKVDLPAVVSKWVGETEKNLQQVFAEAEDANAVMFFDEAESFFAKRGDVKGAQDRWAMMETDYLLQRIESYTGAVILATNLRQQIDEAFLRRIHVIVEFPFPDAEQRAELWRRALARRLPAASSNEIENDFAVGHLADRYSLGGAAIAGIVEDAELAMIAAGSPRLDARFVNDAVAAELRKVGRSALL